MAKCTLFLLLIFCSCTYRTINIPVPLSLEARNNQAVYNNDIKEYGHLPSSRNQVEGKLLEIDTILVKPLKFYTGGKKDVKFDSKKLRRSKNKVKIDPKLYSSLHYPMIARRYGINGQATCAFLFESSGKVVKQQVLTSEFPFFNDGMIADIVKGKFFTFPDRRKIRKTKLYMWCVMEVEWKLKQNPK